jgi:hypothetical protein
LRTNTQALRQDLGTRRRACLEKNGSLSQEVRMEAGSFGQIGRHDGF